MTRLSVIFPFIKYVLIRLEKYQDLEKLRWESTGSHKPHKFTAKLVTHSALAGNNNEENRSELHLVSRQTGTNRLTPARMCLHLRHHTKQVNAKGITIIMCSAKIHI